MNKNYRYNRSSKNFQIGGQSSMTGPKNPGLSSKLAAGITGALGAIGVGVNRATDASRVKRASKAAAKGNMTRANRIAGKLSGQAYSDYMMSRKSNAAGPYADEQRRGGSTNRRRK